MYTDAMLYKMDWESTNEPNIVQELIQGNMNVTSGLKMREHFNVSMQSRPSFRLQRYCK